MKRSVKIRAWFAACCFLILLCLSACAIGGGKHNEADGSFADSQVSESEYDTTGTESDGESPVAGNSQETAVESKDSGQLSSVEDVGLHAVDDSGRNYAFSYHQEEFSARYTPDNWKVVDSYKITDTEDIVVICRALSEAHPVHGRDMESFRTHRETPATRSVLFVRATKNVSARL